MRYIAEDLIAETSDGSPRLIAGRRKSDGRLRFPSPAGTERDKYDRFLLSPHGTLWSYTIQRFRPKVPYARNDTENFKPYAVGYVEIPGEIIVEAPIETERFEELKIGMPMTLAVSRFELAGSDEVFMFGFRPLILIEKGTT